MALDPSIFVHENALCEGEEIGPRTRIGPFAHVMKGAFVGADCELGDHAVVAAGAWLRNRVIVRDNAFIADHVTTEDDVVVGPNVVFTGEAKDDTFLTTRVKRGAILGATSTIVRGITIGERARIEAGCVVTRRAGVPVGRKHGGFVFHNTRHTAVTNLVNAGVPAHEAMAISGHRTRSVFDRYSLTLKAQTRAALERVSTALPATLPPAHVLPLPTSRRRRRDANGDTLAHTPHEDEAKVCSGKAAKGAES